METPNFDDIRPYVDAEIPAALARIAQSELIPQVLRFIYPQTKVEDSLQRLRQGAVGAQERVLLPAGHVNLREVLPAVRRDISDFVGDAEQFDDLTMMCLEYKGQRKEQVDGV